MTKEERRILHGLYYARERINESLLYSSGEILWLAKTRIPKTKDCHDESGNHKNADPGLDQKLASGLNAPSVDAERPLQLLHERGYVVYGAFSHHLEIQVTAKGAEKAMQLDSPIGYIDHQYRDHKDGMLGLLITIIVSAIVAWITASQYSSG